MGVDAIAAVSVARPLRAGVERYGARGAPVNGACPPNSGRAPRLSTARPHAARPPAPHGARAQVADRPVAGSRALTWPSKPVRTSRPPMSSAAVTTSEWATRQATVAVGLDRERLDLGLDDDVGEPRRPEERDDRRRRAVLPAQLAGRGVEAERVEPVAHDEQALGVPVEAARLVADRRGEAGRPGAARSLEPELRPAQRVGVGRRPARPRSIERARRPRSGRRPRRAWPLPPQRQRARRPPG